MLMENQWVKKHTFIRLRIKPQAHTQIKRLETTKRETTPDSRKLKTVTQHFCRPWCRGAVRKCTYTPRRLCACARPRRNSGCGNFFVGRTKGSAQFRTCRWDRAKNSAHALNASIPRCSHHLRCALTHSYRTQPATCSQRCSIFLRVPR